MMFVPGAVRAASLYISPIDIRASTEESFDVSLWLKTEGRALDEIEAVITYPEDYLTLVSVTPLAPFEISLDEKEAVSPAEGEIALKLTSAQPVDRDSVVAVLSFRTVQAGSGRIFLEYQTRVRSSGQAVPLQVVGSRITIVNRNVSQGAETERNGDSSDEDGGAVDVPDDIFIQNIIDEESSIFKAEEPEIRGRTSVPYAPVEIRVDKGLVSDKIRADAKGEWTWRLPTALLPGSYYVDIRAVHPMYDAVFDSDVVLLDRVLYDVAVTQYSIEIDGPYLVEPGSAASFEISFLHDGSTEDRQIQTPLKVSYRFFDSAFIDMYEEEEEQLIVGAETVVVKTVHVPQDIIEGEYTFMVGATLGEQYLEDQRFQIMVKVPLRKRIIAVRKWIVGFGIVFGGVLLVSILSARKRASVARAKNVRAASPSKKKSVPTPTRPAPRRKPGPKKPTKKK